MLLVLWWVALYFLVRPSCIAGLVTSSSAPPKTIQYRPGTGSDSCPIALQLGKELMNPLGVRGERFLVAFSEDQPRIGWAQIRPLSNEAQIQQETDEAMWDEFEANDNIEVPVGFKSLPWTPEYRKFAEASSAAKQKQTRQAVLEQTRQETPKLYELASVWVDPAYRGRGIGTELVRRVLQRHCKYVGPATSVYLLTLASTSQWYRENFGFKLVPDEGVPEQMAFEVKAGKLITGFIGAELVCMQGSS